MSKTADALRSVLGSARAVACLTDEQRAAIDEAIFEVELAEGCREEEKRIRNLPFDDEAGLPNGCTLYWRANQAGGRVYFSDEVGGGVFVWDTCLVNYQTIMAAMVQEFHLRYPEQVAAKRKEAGS